MRRLFNVNVRIFKDLFMVLQGYFLMELWRNRNIIFLFTCLGKRTCLEKVQRHSTRSRRNRAHLLFADTSIPGSS